MNDREAFPRHESDLVLIDVKAKPSGWPPASPDPDSGRAPQPASGAPAHNQTTKTQVSTVSGDCRALVLMTMSSGVEGRSLSGHPVRVLTSVALGCAEPRRHGVGLGFVK